MNDNTIALPPNQQTYWDKVHAAKEHNAYSGQPNEFAKEVALLLSPYAYMVELGCGIGNDSVFFAQRGNTVIATDFSPIVIAQDREKYLHITRLKFEIVDISKQLSFENDVLDAVYARLSLHYFTNRITKQIFGEITRILKPGGIFAFMCKSTNDSSYGQGEKIGQDMFNKNGHIRHFFSQEYAMECLEDKFEVIRIITNEESLYGKQSSAVKVIARKK